MPVIDVPKRLLLGRARPSDEAERTLLPKRLALPVFASDPVSSVAYAGQELLLILALGGVALLALAPSVALAVCLVVAIVVVSYGQVVRAYPGGGGSYAAAGENLGPRAGTATAASLTVDYVLTVAVSTAAAAQTVVGVVPEVRGYELLLAIAGVLLVTLVNLRGRREAGWAAMVPAYGFVLVVGVTVVVGLVRAATGDTPRAPSADLVLADAAASGSWIVVVPLVLRAFASGGAALAGVEAIANGVPSLRPPRPRNAATTLLVVGAITVALFAGVIVLAGVADVRIAGDPCDFVLPDCATVTQEGLLPQLATAVFGAGSAAVPVMVVATVGVLLAAANSAYNGFPLLAAVLAEDRYAPASWPTGGDRLAYTNGILFLSAGAVGVLLTVNADVSRLVDLYLLGLLLSFTLAQVGMARRFRGELAVTTARPWPRRGRLALATLAAVATGTVLLVSGVVKVPQGAWATLVAIAVLYLLMRAVRRHYDSVAASLALDDSRETMPARVHAVVLVSRLHKPVLRAIAYARATRPASLEAVTVAVEPAAAAAVLAEWERLRIPVPLRVLDSPYREITGPLMEHVAELHRRNPRDAVTVFVPEYVVGRWWQALLHNQSTLWLKSRLEAAPGVMVVSVPWQLGPRP